MTTVSMIHFDLRLRFLGTAGSGAGLVVAAGSDPEEEREPGPLVGSPP